MQPLSDPEAAKAAAEQFRSVHKKIKQEVQRVIVGQEQVIDAVLTALLVGGHVMLEGVPGLGKTILVRSLGEAVDVKFSRIQFTPDMMPADIQGTSVLVDAEGGGHEVRFQEGPLVANLVLADEINRATPKTQSALLEAMQEKQITVGRRTIKLSEPFCVMSTQNPVEQEGTYPLPEAQLDRFLFKVIVGYPKVNEYRPILDRTTVKMREVVRSVPVPEHVQDYAVHLVVATQPNSEFAPAMVSENVLLGASPRGAQGLLLGGKVQALLAGRYAVSCDDIRAVAADVLRHRVIVNFQGQAEGFTSEHVIQHILEHVQVPATA
ncbi:MAG: AAA family ATPase [Planctomycetota bacterium]